MLETRCATVADAALITAHRKAMFVDAHDAQEPVLAEMSRNFEPWVKRMLADGIYAGWITSVGDRPVASAGLMILDWAPHFLDPAGEHRGYVLNVYVVPEYRRRGLARALLQRCLDEARTRKIRVVALHASNAGRPVYEGMGFRSTSEMYIVDRAEC
jgi:ribosomal protein S18 acetylase RimI-like enzyme